MAPVSTATPEPKGRGGIDYSKFDCIEDSDDDKPKDSATPAQAKPTFEKPHCHNCHQDIVKTLRCGVCKKAEYCSAQCQKDDWRFHKRVCKKPEEPKPKDEPPAKKEAERQKKTEARKRAESEEKVVDNDENITWYRHREWKPTAEPKKDFKPTQITDAAVVDSARPANAGSAWNAAGTWEEKDVTQFAKESLKAKLATWPDIDAVGGVLSASAVESVDGEASKPVIRGKMRHMFDLSFNLKFSFRWMDSSGQQKAEGSVAVNDFTNDTFAEGVLSPPDVKTSFSGGAKLDPGRRQAVEAAVGAGSWPPAQGTLMHRASCEMKRWVEEDYQKAT